MLGYILRRLFYMIPTLFAVSLVAFLIIQLPPGDFVTTTLSRLEQADVDHRAIEALRRQYGLDQPVLVQYARWMGNILTRGNFGYSFKWGRPVSELIWERVSLTVVISLSALLFTWILAFPIGVYSAIRKYSWGDYIATSVGFIGLATPNFLLALIFMYVAFAHFGQSVGGLFSPAYVNSPWSWGKVLDLLSHLWIPMIVLATSGTASLIRIMRANLLDELTKPYVTTARAKGLRELKLVSKYPVRVALNPFVSSLAWLLPSLVSGSTIVAVVLSLPTTGPMLLDALLAQDMYLAGSIILLLSVLTVFGTLLSDLLLAWLDPRIRFEGS